MVSILLLCTLIFISILPVIESVYEKKIDAYRKINETGTCASASCHREEHKDPSSPPPPPPSEFSYPCLDITLLCLASSVGQSYASDWKLKFDKSDFQAITLIKQACIYISGALTKKKKIGLTWKNDASRTWIVCGKLSRTFFKLNPT